MHTDEMNQEDKKIHAITFAGRLGAGKTSTADAVAAGLGYDRFSAGRFFRDEAAERGITFQELHEIMDSDDQVDLTIDERQKEFLNSTEHYVIDSRLGHIFAPHAFNVFLEIDEEIAAQRIFDDLQKNPDRKTEMVKSVEEMLEHNRKRFASEQLRYKELYDIDDHMNPDAFNFIIRTDEYNLEEVTRQIIDAYEAWKA